MRQLQHAFRNVYEPATPGCQPGGLVSSLQSLSSQLQSAFRGNYDPSHLPMAPTQSGYQFATVPGVQKMGNQSPLVPPNQTMPNFQRQPMLDPRPMPLGTMPVGHQYAPFDYDDDPLGRQRKERATHCCCRPLFWVICCLPVLVMTILLLVLYNYVTSTFRLELHNTTFDFWNYFVPQFQFLIAGSKDSVSMSDWYKGMSDTDPLIGDGPGPNTRSYYGYKTVKKMLSSFGPRLKEGTLERSNELGMQLLTDEMWPETGHGLFGFDNGDHATVRKYLGAVLDGAEKPGRNCDGSSCWNLAWLRKVFRERIEGLEQIASSDLPWILTVVLHKVHLNADISDEEAKQFANFQDQLLRVVPYPRNMVTEVFLGDYPIKLKEQYLNQYKAAIAAKWPREDWAIAVVKLTLLANAMLDSVALHAGPALATSLEHLLALLYMVGEPGKGLARPMSATDEAGIRDFIWEGLRRYPPVSAVPYWAENEDEVSWRHEVLSLHMALQDPTVFTEPLEFKPGRPELNSKDSNMSIGFAEPALVDGDILNGNSHSCPGKQLSLAVLQAFLQEFSAHAWKADSTHIYLNSFGTSGFTLRKLVY